MLGTLIRCVRRKATTHGPLKASETRLSTKEEVRPYHIDTILFFPRDPLGFASNKYIFLFLSSEYLAVQWLTHMTDVCLTS